MAVLKTHALLIRPASIPMEVIDAKMRNNAVKVMNTRMAVVETSMNVRLSVNTDILYTNAKPIPVHGALTPMALTIVPVPMAINLIGGQKSIQMNDA